MLAGCDRKDVLMLAVVSSRKKGNPAYPHMDLFWEATVGTLEQL